MEINYCNISSILYLPIETLNLANNNIGILGLENITNKLKNKFCTLKNLNLSHNYIGNEGCFMIGESFKENKSLIDINLSENNILDEGAIYLANNLRNEINKKIKKINLKNNSITSEGIIQFCSILKNEPIERFEKINFSLNDLDDTGLSDYGLFISRFQNITSLLLSNNFSKTSLNNYFIYCQNLSNLKKIKFYQINLTEESSHNFTQILLNNKNIEKLNISSNRNLHDGIFDITQGIEHNIKLTYLNLKTCFIGDRGAEALALHFLKIFL